MLCRGLSYWKQRRLFHATACTCLVWQTYLLLFRIRWIWQEILYVFLALICLWNAQVVELNWTEKCLVHFSSIFGIHLTRNTLCWSALTFWSILPGWAGWTLNNKLWNTLSLFRLIFESGWCRYLARYPCCSIWRLWAEQAVSLLGADYKSVSISCNKTSIEVTFNSLCKRFVLCACLWHFLCLTLHNTN